jgi:hypothetical protein
MTETYHLLQTTPVGGFIHDWLVAGPAAIPVADLARFDRVDFRRQIAEHFRQAALPFAAQPVEQTHFSRSDEHGEQTFTWRAVGTLDDHFVNLTGFYHTTHYLCAWAYAQVELPEAVTVTATLTTNGPADLWLNGEHSHARRDFRDQQPYSQRCQLAFHAGRNGVLVRLENVAARTCPFVLALHLADLPEQAKVVLPSAMPLPERRQRLAQYFAAAYLTQDLYHREQPLTVRWPADLPGTSELTLRLQTPAGRIYAEMHPTVRGGAEVTLGKSYQFPDGPYQIVLMPTLAEYYEHGLRITQRIDLHIANSPFAETPTGTYAERRLAALDHAARRPLKLFSEIAKMALGRWSEVQPAVLEATIASINARADCSDFDLVGLLGMLYRFGDDPHFPAALIPPLEACILNFKYWLDEPGQDAMCYWTENHQILFHTCQLLAGQRYPDQHFTNNGEVGAWHRAKGEERALTWLHRRAREGFREWDSNCYFQEDVLALTHLADLAESVEVAEMAAVILDKLLYTLGLNSFRGVFGSTHGRTYAPLIKGGRLESTSGIARLLWGLGSFNDKIKGSVSLACATSYELPPLIAAIATSQIEELWSREQHAGRLDPATDRLTGEWAINKVTYKTPDFMLCSAQDYLPGLRGYQQHLWQATFGPDAVVFVTHPPHLSEESAHRPNFWHGNVILPRVAQWKEALIALHHLPDDDWLGFTHAYFPLHAFDEHTLDATWAFARKGDGYLALTAAGGLTLITQGQSAYCELRSPGLRNIWFLHLGRAASDGSFADFQAQIRALDLTFAEDALHTTTLRGDSLDFGWQGPLLVNECEQPLAGFPHYESPFCVAELGAEGMAIHFRDQQVRLDFSPR